MQGGLYKVPSHLLMTVLTISSFKTINHNETSYRSICTGTIRINLINLNIRFLIQVVILTTAIIDFIDVGDRFLTIMSDTLISETYSHSESDPKLVINY